MNEKKKCDVQRPLECVRERFSASVASQVVCNGFVRLVLAIEIDKNRFEEGDQLDAFMICLRAARSRPTRKINTFFLMKFIFTFSHNLGEISRKICRRRRDNFEKKFHPKKKKSETTRKCDANYREIFRCRPIKFFIEVQTGAPTSSPPPLHFFILKKI